MNILARFLIRFRRCKLASTLALLSAALYGITFFFAIEQTTVMVSELAKPEVMVLIGLPTLVAVLAVVFSSKCRMKIDNQEQVLTQ